MVSYNYMDSQLFIVVIQYVRCRASGHIHPYNKKNENVQGYGRWALTVLEMLNKLIDFGLIGCLFLTW